MDNAAEPAFRLTTDDVDTSARVVTVSGELDLYTTPELRRALEERRLRDAVVDLVDVGFVDSTALALLVSAAKRFRGRGGDLRLVCNSPVILKALAVTGLNSVFRIHASLDDALAALLVDRDRTPAPT